MPACRLGVALVGIPRSAFLRSHARTSCRCAAAVNNVAAQPRQPLPRMRARVCDDGSRVPPLSGPHVAVVEQTNMSSLHVCEQTRKVCGYLLSHQAECEKDQLRGRHRTPRVAEKTRLQAVQVLSGQILQGQVHSHRGSHSGRGSAQERRKPVHRQDGAPARWRNAGHVRVPRYVHTTAYLLTRVLLNGYVVR